ncbi:sensor histidine kinase [Streptomyces sp. NPDC127038]|uniref:sensor histidine kinase n=1 Tax=Streptomyces sp. NPDC127038 TaxID=3347114 RepID=UPI0036462E9B
MAVSTVLAQRAFLLRDLDRRVAEAAERDRDGFLGGGPGAGTDLGPSAGRGQPVGTISARLDADGNVVAAEIVRRSGGPRDLGAAQRSALAAVGTDSSPRTRAVPGLGTYRVAVLDGGGRPVLTALPMDDVQDALRGLAVVEAVTAAAAATAVGCVCAAVLRHRLRPLERVTALAVELSGPPRERDERSDRTPGTDRAASRGGPGAAPAVPAPVAGQGRGPGAGCGTAPGDGAPEPARGAEDRTGRGGAVALRAQVPGRRTAPGSEADRIGAALGRLMDRAEAAHARHLREEEHLRSGEERLRAGEERMRRFLSDASHELRTPLAAVSGYAELMTRGAGPAEAATAWRRVSAESARMTSLVEDLLLLARLDDGHRTHPPESAEVDLTMLVAEGVREARAAGEDHLWRLGRLPDTPALVAGDEARLRRAVAHLLANARAHTPPGTTVLTTVEATATTCTVRVHDDGPGIPPALLPHVFERFTRADASRSRVSPGHGGSGLGLAVTAAVARAHHGGVRAESVPGRTEFTLELPALRPVPAPRPSADAVPAGPAPGEVR